MQPLAALVLAAAALTANAASAQPAQTLEPLKLVDAMGKTVGRLHGQNEIAISVNGGLYLFLIAPGRTTAVEESIVFPEEQAVYYLEPNCQGAPHVPVLYLTIEHRGSGHLWAIRPGVMLSYAGQLEAYIPASRQLITLNRNTSAKLIRAGSIYCTNEGTAGYEVVPAQFVPLNGQFTMPMRVR